MFTGKLKLWRKMTTWKRVALMLTGCSFVAAAIIAGVTLFPQREKAAISASWVLLNGENHLLVTEGIPLIFPALQESDRRKIRGGVLENALRPIRRPADFSELKFYEVSPENKLKPVAPRRFSITIEDEEDGVSHTVQLASFKVKGKTVLSPADPDFKETSYKIASSSDGKNHVVWNMGGMWLLEEGNLEKARKISSELHNNKIRRQLEQELTEIQQARGIDTAWEMIEWNYNPRFSPDGTKIVYSTNRDFETRDSMSVWIFDLETNTEKRLFGGGRYDYGVIGWLNDEQMLVGKSDGEDIFARAQVYLVDARGNKKEVIVPDGIGLQTILPNGVVAYVSYVIQYVPYLEMEGAYPMAVATAVGIGTIDPKTLTIVPKGVERALPAEAAPATFKKVSLNPSGTTLAYSYSETRDGRYGYNILKIVDIIRNKDLEIDLEKAGIDPWELLSHTLRWISDDQILIHTMRGERYFDASADTYVQTPVFSTWLHKLGGTR
ncbi:MAG: hypothetical protein M1552_07060 [Firmicutes bacterium]|nr:hypothetical protein [Bacillota bacterium]